jgi:D-glycero-alpha-D-manno-heptose-7-phosphate kinase
MIITRTPFRISFFGGGTDYPAWYRKEGGAVLCTTIDKYCYITCRYLPPFFRELKHRIVWRHVEAVYSIGEILHPAIKEGLRFMGFDDSQGLEIHYQGDLPARSGMGSSSSFAVGLVRALLELRGQAVSKHDLALKSIELEQNRLKENVGSQDQMAVSYGGMNVIRFGRDGGIDVEPVQIQPERKAALETRLLLFYSGASRSASDVATDIIANMRQNDGLLRRMQALVGDALAVLTGDGDLDDFGRLLNETWTLKKRQSSLISNPLVDSIYIKAIEAGALGGKLLGAGAAGFMVFYAPLESQASVKSALSEFLHVPFRFDNQGCTLLHSSIA